ncbi:MAG: hypothetical protein ACPLXC_01240 [Candidatus Pacearchaeota archaeon]
MAEKKKFFDVKLEVLESIVPLLAVSPDSLINRVVKLDLTKILKGKNCEAKFIVKRHENDFIGEIFSFTIFPSYIRRLIGHNISIVEDSFIVKAKDTNLRVKPFLITRKKVHRGVKKALRDETKDFLIKIAEERTRDKIFHAVITGILQKQLSKRLKKIYPLAVCELRVVKVEKTK